VCNTCFELACGDKGVSKPPLPTASPTESNPFCDKWTWPECLKQTGEECQAIVEADCPDLEQVGIIPEGMGVTADYRLDRVRIFVDSAGIVNSEPRVG
jgi:hypothetical protein